jgi:hypothetical protein
MWLLRNPTAPHMLAMHGWGMTMALKKKKAPSQKQASACQQRVEMAMPTLMSTKVTSSIKSRIRLPPRRRLQAG